MNLTIDFAFEGFRLIGKKFGLFLAWCLFYILISVVAFAAAAVVSGPQLLILIGQGSKLSQSDPNAVLALLGGIFPGLSLALIIAIIGSLMFRCAVYRAMLKPKQKSPLFLRLGADEWRQFLLMLLMIVVVIVLYLIVAIVAGVIIGLAAASQNDVIRGIGIFVGVVVAVCILVWFLLRVSLIGVHAFDKNKIDLGAALNVTKGKVWSLFGGYIILFILLLIIQIVFTSVFYGITLASTGFNAEPLRQAANPDFTQLMTLMGPVFIAQMLIGIVTSVLGEVALLAATVAAYKALTPAPVDAVVAAFEEALPDKP